MLACNAFHHFDTSSIIGIFLLLENEFTARAKSVGRDAALYRADEKTAPAFEEAGAELPQELHSAAAFT
jgi:hypothetical protein